MTIKELNINLEIESTYQIYLKFGIVDGNIWSCKHFFYDKDRDIFKIRFRSGYTN